MNDPQAFEPVRLEKAAWRAIERASGKAMTGHRREFASLVSRLEQSRHSRMTYAYLVGMLTMTIWDEVGHRASRGELEALGTDLDGEWQLIAGERSGSLTPAVLVGLRDSSASQREHPTVSIGEMICVLGLLARRASRTLADIRAEYEQLLSESGLA